MWKGDRNPASGAQCEAQSKRYLVHSVNGALLTLPHTCMPVLTQDNCDIPHPIVGESISRRRLAVRMQSNNQSAHDMMSNQNNSIIH